jgi:hypothetical protein
MYIPQGSFPQHDDAPLIHETHNLTVPEAYFGKYTVIYPCQPCHPRDAQRRAEYLQARVFIYIHRMIQSSVNPHLWADNLKGRAVVLHALSFREWGFQE